MTALSTKKELANFDVRVISTCENVGMGDEAIILESIYEAYSRCASFGYILKDKKFCIDDRKAEYVKYIFDDYLRSATK